MGVDHGLRFSIELPLKIVVSKGGKLRVLILGGKWLQLSLFKHIHV